ncbi:MAG: site-specific DNA-methyltransferase, partial [Opitutaceae bacterium]
MSAKPIKAFKHKHATRAAIPSHEEAGAEAASPKVAQGPANASHPKNPVVHRGQDPELFWLNKYGATETEDILPVDIRSLYRHEHIEPERLVRSLLRVVQTDTAQGDLFGHTAADFFTQTFGTKDELEKASSYYTHRDGWTNRLIQGDSLLVMASLLEREGMAGQVQCIYLDPPYGIKYGSNWQIRLNNRTVTDGQDDSLSGEPEQIKAFRDTWELGIHSYLSYLRDRLLVAKDLLHASGSCFVQISDENVHLVRCLMDEVFGSENFVGQIFFQTTTGRQAAQIDRLGNYVVWYAKEIASVKSRKLFIEKLTEGETLGDLQSQGVRSTGSYPVEFEGRTFRPQPGNHWKVTQPGMKRLISEGRVVAMKTVLRYKRLPEDFPLVPLGDIWTDASGGAGADKIYVVQTGNKVVQRCVLMTTDPG